MCSSSDPTNAGYVAVRAQTSGLDILTGNTGTGSILPFAIYVNNTTKAVQYETDGTMTNFTLPSCQAYKSAASQSISSSAFTAITYDVDAWDNAAFHNTSSNTSRMTVPYNGKYRVTATVPFITNNTGSRLVVFRVDGNANDRYGYMTTNALSNVTLSTFVTTATTLNLNSGSYVEVYAFQDSGIILAVSNETTQAGISRFTIEYLGL